MADIRTEFKRIDNIPVNETRKSESVFHSEAYESLFKDKDEFQRDTWVAAKKDGQGMIPAFRVRYV